MSSFSKLLDKIVDCCGEDARDSRRIAGCLEERARSLDEAGDWRRSAPDLLRALGLDASYGTRKRLALDLGYDEELVVTKGSAEMNLWLLGALRDRLAAEGIELPLAARS